MLDKKCSGKPFVQIGANVGADKFFELCINNSPSFIILVEPSVSNAAALQACYKGFKCPVHIEHVAITDDKNIHHINMYSPTSSNAHYSIQPMKNWSKSSVYSVSATTLQNLFNKYSITEVGLLFIDTEGNDARIINSINFKTFTIDNIIYENWGFDQSAFENYSVLNGMDGMKYTKELLEKQGYQVSSYDFDGKDSNYLAKK
jgi:FkbM family methyltransferase